MSHGCVSNPCTICFPISNEIEIKLSMHPEIYKFWSKNIIVNCIEIPTSHISNVPYYYINDANGYKIVIACPYSFYNKTSIPRSLHKAMIYWFDNKQYYEEEILKIIKISAFV